MGRGDLHEAVAAGLVGRALPGRHQRVVGARERDPVDDHQLAGLTGHVEALPQRERAEQAGVRVVHELPRQLGQLGVALGERGQVRQPLAHRLGRGLGGPAGGEQAERAPVGGVHQLRDLLERGLDESVAARRREVAGDVQDRLLAVVERRAHVEPAPRQHTVGALRDVRTRRRHDALGRPQPHRRRHRVEVAAELERRARHHDRLVGEQLVAHGAEHLQRRHAQLVATALPVALGHPEHVGVGVGGHPLGGLEQLLRPALGLGRDRVVAEVLGERRDQRPRRVAHQHERVGELLRYGVDPARRRRVDRVAQRVTRVGQVVGLGSVHVARRAPRGPVHLRDGQLVGRGLGDPGDQLVGLVDHDRVVLRDHRHALDRVDRQQRVVRDHHLRAHRPLAGTLGEALGAVRALRGPQALPVRHRDLPPDPVGVPRRVVALTGAAVLRLLLDPLPHRQHLGAQRPLGQLDQRTLVVGHALADPVQAGVVGAPLQHGVRRGLVEHVLHGLDQRRDVAFDELVLQRERRGGDHDPVVVEHRRHQVAQRLAGAGAGLHQQVLAGLHRGRRPPRPSRPGRVAPARRAPRPRPPAPRARGSPRRLVRRLHRTPEHPMCRSAPPS